MTLDKAEGGSLDKRNESVAYAIKTGKILSDDGEYYGDLQDAIDAASEYIFLPPGEHRASGGVATVPSSKDRFTIEGCGKKSIIHGGQGTALQWDGKNGELKDVQLKTDVGQGGTAYGIEVNGKEFYCRNVTILFANSAAFRCTSNDFHITDMVIDGQVGNVIGIGFWLTGVGVSGTVSNLDVRGTQNVGVFNGGVDYVQWSNVMVRNCDDNGFETSADTESNVISNLVSTGNNQASGTGDYVDAGTNNVVSGVVGNSDVSGATTPKDSDLYAVLA